MKEYSRVPQVGAPDPELNNSPIFDEGDDESLSLDLGVEYPLGQYVLSGDELLHCEGGGVWVRKGEVGG